MFLRASEDAWAQTRLERQDLLAMEPKLHGAIARFLKFSSYGLYFPASPPPEMVTALPDGSHSLIPVYHASEKKVLLPLHHQGELLGIFLARGISGRVTKTMLQLWSCLCEQVVDTLRMWKMARTDPRTGLANMVCLEETLAREIQLVHRGLWPDNPVCLEEGFSEFSASVGLICLDVDGFRRINERMGYCFGDVVLKNVADVVSRIAPEQALCARLCDDTLVVCFSGATTAKCHQLALSFAQAVDELECRDSIDDTRVRVSVSQGYATYPQDFHGRQLRRSEREQTGLMLEKAKRALRNAWEKGSGHVCGFSGIVQNNGFVLDNLPLNRVLISLGRSVDAHEGQRFLVWSAVRPWDPEAQGKEASAPRSRICKGEVRIIEVHRETSVAEIILLHDPGQGIAPDDQLTLLTPGQRAGCGTERPQQAEGEVLPGGQRLMSSSEFLKHWQDARQAQPCFALVLAHLEGISRETERIDHAQAESIIQQVAGLCAQNFDSNLIMGRFSFSTVACLVPGWTAEDMLPLCKQVVHQAEKSLDQAVSIGLAGYPCLAYGKADVLENCRKALEHALLLPEADAVMFCSTSLTVSADRYFSEGDIFSAVEEYKQALLADENNHLARNSLGVCYARLGKYTQALAQFSAILRQKPDDIMASYNQGHTFVKQGEVERARECFQRCLDLEPKHVFSLLRLGQIAEQNKDMAQARDFFEQARELPGGPGLTHRYLARLELQQGKNESAREHLHQALVHNSRDALAMQMLAQMYLEQGEDPEIAETLARQSVALRPEQSAFWETLALTLEMQGRHEEAGMARERRN
jgi:diguanylate cyclase (GGDEF)-like protein